MGHLASTELVMAELVPEGSPPPRRPRPPSWLRRHLPLILFVATCLTTFLAGSQLTNVVLYTLEYVAEHHSWPTDLQKIGHQLPGWCYDGLIYAASIMTILLSHEMGHYLQTRRYGVPASLPIFLPMPIGPIGTIGAVIGMRPGVGDRKAIFDIGITGPLAGLVPTLFFCVVGLRHAGFVPGSEQYGEPLLIQLLAWLRFGPRPEGLIGIHNPMLFAAWVGLLITSLNLLPIGQLDGGHILYALLRKKAHHVASLLLMAAAAAVVVATVIFDYYIWTVMILLLLVMGPNHPPTANDDVPLGPTRIVLGWLTLAFVLVGFTPMPFKL